MGRCAAEGCDRDSHARGWCPRHYMNWRCYGNPIPQRDRGLTERLDEVGWTVTASGCWEWNGARNESGYGLITARRLGLRSARVHRLVYESRTGITLASDQLLLHRCDNPPCVNPDHLVVGTQADNMADMVAKGRHWMHGRSHCPNGHDLRLPGATRTINRGGTRGTETFCVECARERGRRYRQLLAAR